MWGSIASGSSCPSSRISAEIAEESQTINGVKYKLYGKYESYTSASVFTVPELDACGGGCAWPNARVAP